MTITIATSSHLPLRLVEFARAHKIDEALPLVADLTERLFPMAQRVDVELVTDDEQADQQCEDRRHRADDHEHPPIAAPRSPGHADRFEAVRERFREAV